MPCCAIITCKLKSQTSSVRHGGISFHRFPKESEIRELWTKATGRENWIPTKLSTICSRHFKENDFTIKKSGNRYLNLGAIPCDKIVKIYTHSFVVKEEQEDDDIPSLTSQQNIQIDMNKCAMTLRNNQNPQLVQTNITSPQVMAQGNISTPKSTLQEKPYVAAAQLASQTYLAKHFKNKFQRAQLIMKSQRHKIALLSQRVKRLEKRNNSLKNVIEVLTGEKLELADP